MRKIRTFFGLNRPSARIIAAARGPSAIQRRLYRVEELIGSDRQRSSGHRVVGGQAGINTLASMIYPVTMRSTGLGWALGMGRIGSIVGPAVGGLMLASGLDAKHVYLVCIVPALVGAVSVVLLRWRTSPLPQPVRAV
jgi:MFS family permease